MKKHGFMDSSYQIEYLIFFKVITITHMASMLHPSDKINAKDLIQPLVHDIKNRKEKKNEIARDLMLVTTNN